MAAAKGLDTIHCACGALVMRANTEGIEVHCRRCDRQWVVPFAELHDKDPLVRFMVNHLGQLLAVTISFNLEPRGVPERRGGRHPFTSTWRRSRPGFAAGVRLVAYGCRDRWHPNRHREDPKTRQLDLWKAAMESGSRREGLESAQRLWCPSED